MKTISTCSIMLSAIFLFAIAVASTVLADGRHTDPDTKSTRPDSHAPLGVMGDHAHGKGEWMLSYRLMAMGMEGLRDGTDPIVTETALHKYAVVPIRMNMQMHMLGVMFAPHKNLTLMAMTSYRDNFMEMQGDKTHGHSQGGHGHAVGYHEMESAGLGDSKLAALIPLLRSQDIIVLLNTGLSLPTGSIEQESENGILPYPMQLGSGSFELMPGVTFVTTRNNWSIGAQTHVAIPLNENNRAYRRAPPERLGQRFRSCPL